MRWPSWGPGSFFVMAILAFLSHLQGLRLSSATTEICDRFGTVRISSGTYVYQQNEWDSTLKQCATVDPSTGSWSLSRASFDLPTDGAPATYPSTFKGCHWGDCTSRSNLPIRVGSLSKATSSWSTVQPSSGAYDVAYDLWTNKRPATSGQPNGSEIMVWLDSRGGVAPAGSQVATARLDGSTWRVWTARMPGWNYVAYQRRKGTSSVSGLDLGAFIRDSIARRQTRSSWYLLDAEAGFEIWQGGQGLATTSFVFRAS